MCRDNGKEHGSYYSILGLYRDDGQENGNYSLFEISASGWSSNVTYGRQKHKQSNMPLFYIFFWGVPVQVLLVVWGLGLGFTRCRCRACASRFCALGLPCTVERFRQRYDRESAAQASTGFRLPSLGFRGWV